MASAHCKECGKKMGGLFNATHHSNGVCFECWEKSYLSRQNASETGEEPVQPMAEALDSIMLTTETALNVPISRLGVVTAECAFGINAFKDLFINVRNIVGGRSTAVEEVMRDSREIVFRELKREAHARGANAVIGVSLNYCQIGGGGNVMVLLVAAGTAVVIE